MIRENYLSQQYGGQVDSVLQHMQTLEPSNSGVNYYTGHNLNMNPSAGV